MLSESFLLPLRESSLGHSQSQHFVLPRYCHKNLDFEFSVEHLGFSVTFFCLFREFPFCSQQSMSVGAVFRPGLPPQQKNCMRKLHFICKRAMPVLHLVSYTASRLQSDISTYSTLLPTKRISSRKCYECCVMVGDIIIIPTFRHPFDFYF